MPERRITLSLEPDFRNVDLARAAIRGICGDFIKANCGGHCCFSYCLAITEAMNNAVEHSGSSTIVVEAELDRDELRCRIITEGPRFDSSQPASLPENCCLEEAAEGGYGLSLIQTFNDRLEYDYRDGRNILTLVKSIPKSRKDD